MSIAASNWAWTTDLPANLKLVLVALAHCHNGKTGQCNPKVETIASMVGRSERPVREALKQLREMGYIQPIQRRKGKRQASNHYALALDGVVFQTAADSTLKKNTKCKKQHPEDVENSTLYIEQESEHKVAHSPDPHRFLRVVEG